MADRHRDIVSRLTELVEVASTAISQQSGTNREQQSSRAPNNEEALRRLYPSLGPVAPTQGLSALPSTSRNTSQNRPGAAFNASVKYTGKCRKRKHAQEKETMSYKDVFFINDPRISKVPRRQDRQHFYDCGLVGSAVSFTSSMQEHDIREAIYNAIPRFKEMRIKPEFELLKAVGPRLISVPEISNWNYKILKHQTGQGPLYVRAYTFLNVGLGRKIQDYLRNSNDGSDDENDDDSQFPSSLVHVDDSQSLVVWNSETASSSPSSGHDVDGNTKGLNLPSSSKIEKNKTARKPCSAPEQQCPICFCYFPDYIIESHSNDCIDLRAKPEAELYNSLIFDENLTCEVDSDDQNDDTSRESCTTVTATNDVMSPEELRVKIKIMVKKLSENVVSNEKRLYVRRKTLWKDYLDYRKKKWVKKDHGLKLVFVGEPAIDDGGPRREFFEGLYVYALVLGLSTVSHCGGRFGLFTFIMDLLFLGALQQMRMALFRNTATGMIPVESAVAIANEEFLMAGELCASSICQGGPGPYFLSDWVFDFLVGGFPNVQFPTCTDLQDEKLNDFKSKVCLLFNFNNTL